MRIVFGILSSRVSSATVQQLVDAIGPQHTVFIHHDFTQRPQFDVTDANVNILRPHIQTSWGHWSLVEATRLLMKAAMKQVDDFDYFQLLSDTCLPVRPITEFEGYLTTHKPDVTIDIMPLDMRYPYVLWSHGYRFLARKNTMIFRVLRRAREWIAGSGHIRSVRIEAGIVFALPLPLRGLAATRQSLGRAIYQCVYSMPFSSHPFSDGLKCFVGSQWFGCSRRVCEYLVAKDDANPLSTHFQCTHAPDESYFHTLIGNAHSLMDNSPLNSIMPSTHFTKRNARTGDAVNLLEGDEIELLASGKFFARKFSTNPSDVMRKKILARVCDA